MRISALTSSIMLLVLLVIQLDTEAGPPYQMDAEASAQYIASSGVRTAYENLRRNGMSWQDIRDHKLPAMLDRVILGLQDRYSSRVLTDVYIPAFTEAFYDEVNKINRENRFYCVEPKTLNLYAEVIIASCRLHLSVDVSFGVQKVARPFECR
jgi:hypothetical protein